MNILTQKDLNDFHRDGFLLVKNVFGSEEVAKLKSHIEGLKNLEPEAEKNGSYNFVGDLFAKNLGNLVLDERITGIAKQILGPQLVYFGEGSIQTGIRAGRGFHRDNPDRENPRDPDWQNNHFPIIKMGIYLADHKKFGGGLKVRTGSHLSSDFISDPNNPDVRNKNKNQEQGRGKLYNIPNQTGDLMLWSMRLAHSANFIRLKLFPWACFSPPIENKLAKYLPQFLQAKLPYERKAIWIAWGAPSQDLDRYIKWYVDRGDYFEHWKKSAYSEQLASSAAAQGVEIRRPIPEYGSQSF